MTVQRHRLPVFLIACLAILLGSVACGGSNETATEADRTATSTDPGDTASTTTTSSPTTTTTPPPGPQPGATYEGSIEGEPRLTGEVTVVIADSGEEITELMLDFNMQEFSCDGSVMSGGLGLGIRGPVAIVDNTFQTSDGMMSWEGTFDTSESAKGTVEGSLPVFGGDPCPVGPFPWTAEPASSTTTDDATAATTTTAPVGVRPTTSNVESRIGEEATFCGEADAITSRGDGLLTVFMGGLLVYVEPDANLPSRWWEDGNGDDLEFCVTGTVQPADERGSAFITVTTSSQIREASGAPLDEAASGSQGPLDEAAQQFCQAWLDAPRAIEDPVERAQRVQTHVRELARLAPVEIRAGAEAIAELQDTWVEIGPEYDWDLVQAIDDPRLVELMDATDTDMDAFDLYVAQNCGN